MADLLTGNVWNVDTVAGVVTTSPVCIHSIQVRFTTAAAGSFQMITGVTSMDTSTGAKIVDATSTATSTANAFQCVQVFTYGDRVYQGLKKTLCVNVETVIVVLGTPR